MTMSPMLDTMMATLEKHLSTKTVIGEAVTVGDVTMVPVMDLMFGFGGGGGEGRDEKNQNGSGSGGGAGARLAPKAIIVIKGGEVQVLPLVKGSAIEKIVESIPAIVEKFQSMKKEEPAE